MENLQNASKELKNFSKDPIGKYINDIKLQAEDLVLNKFPCRFLELTALLKTSDFNTTASAHNKQNSDTNEQTGDVDGVVSRKRKLDVDLDSAPRSNTAKQIIPCNNLITDIVELVKPRIHQLLEDMQHLKVWIQFLTPRNGDANDFFKSIFDDILSKIQATEMDAEAFSDDISSYFLSRGKVIAKSMKYPQLDDYRRAVEEMDESFGRRMQQTLCDIGNDYATLHDVISKNLQKIKNPRKFDPRTMY